MLTAACSTGDGVSRQPVTIPLPGSGEAGPGQNVSAYYANVLDQMRVAYKDRDLLTLRALLVQHRRAGLPSNISEMLDRYETLASGLAFELAVAENSSVTLIEPVRPLSEPQPYRCELRAPKELPPVMVGGDEAGRKLSLLCSVVVEDVGARGNTSTRRSSLALPVKKEHRLTPSSPLLLPFAVPESRGDVAMRRVHVTVELLPCMLEINGQETQIRRTLCSKFVSIAYPPNHQHIQKAPLKTLQEALRRGSRRYYRHVMLAAHFMPKDKKEKALVLLMRRLRVGTDEQGRVAMAALKELTGESYPITDRRIWLSWWEARKLRQPQEPKKK